MAVVVVEGEVEAESERKTRARTRTGAHDNWLGRIIYNNGVMMVAVVVVVVVVAVVAVSLCFVCECVRARVCGSVRFCERVRMLKATASPMLKSISVKPANQTLSSLPLRGCEYLHLDAAAPAPPPTPQPPPPQPAHADTHAHVYISMGLRAIMRRQLLTK